MLSVEEVRERSRVNAAAYRRAHPDKARAAVKAARAKYDYSASTRESGARWRAANPEAVQSKHQRWYWVCGGRAVVFANSAKRRARVKQQMPAWADAEKIVQIYAGCPEGYHVDHEIPLRGRRVSGLHVESNLRYLPALENFRKSNKFGDLHA